MSSLRLSNVLMPLGALLLGDDQHRFARAHRTLPSGLTCGAQFGSPDAPLVVPNPAISWATYGIYTCDDPVQWYEATTVAAGQMLHFTLTVPEIERFRGARMSAAVVGPGLPAADEAAEDVPDAVMDHATATGEGIAVFASPEDQATCAHLASETMSGASTVKDDRCHFYEPYGGSNLWVVLDDGLAAPEAGTYKIAVFETNGMTAKASFACCDWPEDFITPFDIPETECDLCGALPADNPAWSSLFYEHKSMEDYGGYPPFQQCDGASPIELPQGDSCPPAMDNALGLEVSESCTPHCGRDGVCHSHNILGDCTFTVDWVLAPKLGDANVTKLVVFKGDTLTFRHSTADNLAHNLFQLLDGPALDVCAFDGASELANVEEVVIGHDVTFDEAGEFHFACSIGCASASEVARQGSSCHCQVGQRLTVEVKDASEGMRCHNHASDHAHDHQDDRRTAEDSAAECEEGSVSAFVLGDANYGAEGDGECSELCAPATALAFMAGVEEGACVEQEYPHKVAEKQVQPAGSPMAIMVTIYSNVSPDSTEESDEDSDCHCHSYEEIACPDDAVSDALYDEHIEEITNFCPGVVDGTEANCPYNCYQPMEVLHLHYLECPSRIVDGTYAAVDATGQCHGGSTDVPGEMNNEDTCPVVDLAHAHGADMEADGAEGTHQGDSHGHDHGNEAGDDHGHSHADPAVEDSTPNDENAAAEPVDEESTPDDENAAPCTMFGSIFVVGFLLSLVLSMN